MLKPTLLCRRAAVLLAVYDDTVRVLAALNELGGGRQVLHGSALVIRPACMVVQLTSDLHAV